MKQLEDRFLFDETDPKTAQKLNQAIELEHQILIEQKIKSPESTTANILEIINEKSIFQYIAIFSMFLMSVANGFFGYQIGYILPEPNFECLNKTGIWSKCLEKDACNLPEKSRRYLFEIDSYTHHYQLYCDRAWIKTLSLSSMFFIGGIISLIL